jgi:hypothetical protein
VKSITKKLLSCDWEHKEFPTSKFHDAVFLEQLRLIYPVKKFRAITEPKSSFPCSQKPTNGPHPELFLSRLHLLPVSWTGNKNSPTVTHACRKRQLKWVPGAWRYNWATLPLGDINIEAWSSRVEVGRGEITALLCKKENCWEASKKSSHS